MVYPRMPQSANTNRSLARSFHGGRSVSPRKPRRHFPRYVDDRDTLWCNHCRNTFKAKVTQ